jgi:predicted PurR-regulated permease PerM
LAGTEFWSLFAVYLIIQGLDGNLLVPVLFSEAVNLHPLVIILSVVIFGGLWGFWGVFFAIPLATLIKAVVHAWPDGLAVEDERLMRPCESLKNAIPGPALAGCCVRRFLSASSAPRRGDCWF